MSAMVYRKAGTANRKVTALCDSEIKVTALMGWAIDAPVENNPVRPVLGGTVKRQGTPTTALELMPENRL